MNVTLFGYTPSELLKTAGNFLYYMARPHELTQLFDQGVATLRNQSETSPLFLKGKKIDELTTGLFRNWTNILACYLLNLIVLDLGPEGLKGLSNKSEEEKLDLLTTILYKYEAETKVIFNDASEEIVSLTYNHIFNRELNKETFHYIKEHFPSQLSFLGPAFDWVEDCLEKEGLEKGVLVDKFSETNFLDLSPDDIIRLFIESGFAPHANELHIKMNQALSKVNACFAENTKNVYDQIANTKSFPDHCCAQAKKAIEMAQEKKQLSLGGRA